MQLRTNVSKSIVQRPAKKCANLTKQDPGRARQKSQARAGINFSQPRTNFLADLCGVAIFLALNISPKCS